MSLLFLNNVFIILITSTGLWLACWVYFADRKVRTNQLFCLFTIFNLLWILFTYFSDISKLPEQAYQAILFRNLSFGIGFLFFVTTYFFVRFFPFQTKRNLFLDKIVLTLGIGFFLISIFTNLVVKDVELKEWGNSPVFGGGALYGYGVIVFLTLLILGKLLLKYFRTPKKEKLKIQYFLIGVLIFTLMNLIFNVILAPQWNNFPYYYFGNYSAIFLISFTAFAIVKRELFGIRVILTQLLVGTIAVLLLVNFFVSKSLFEYIWKGALFVTFAFFGWLLVKSVIKEVEQREKLEVLTKELGAANERLIKLDKLKSEFLSFASHQVKTPITVVKGYASLITDGTYGEVSPKIKEVALKIIGASDRMVSLVNNILNFRKIEEGKMEYKFSEINIVDLVRAVTNELKSLVDRKNLSLKVNLPEEKLMVKADEEKLRQVIQNLIDNAVKYTEKGWIEVSVKRENGSVLISVSDSGMGISQELLPHLFEQWTRDSKATKGIQGTGLGLYIAKEIISAHGGEIWAESLGNGSGSTFYVRLKLSA